MVFPWYWVECARVIITPSLGALSFWLWDQLLFPVQSLCHYHALNLDWKTTLPFESWKRLIFRSSCTCGFLQVQLWADLSEGINALRAISPALCPGVKSSRLRGDLIKNTDMSTNRGHAWNCCWECWEKISERCCVRATAGVGWAPMRKGKKFNVLKKLMFSKVMGCRIGM